MYLLFRTEPRDAAHRALQVGLPAFIAFFALMAMQGAWPGLSEVPLQGDGDPLQWGGKTLMFYPGGLALALILLAGQKLASPWEALRHAREGLKLGAWVAVPLMLAGWVSAHALQAHDNPIPEVNEGAFMGLLAIVLIKATLDEAFFRGWMMGRIIPAMGPRMALILTSLIYAMAFATGGPLSMLWGLLSGVVLGLIYLRAHQRIEASIVANALLHISLLSVFVL